MGRKRLALAMGLLVCLLTVPLMGQETGTEAEKPAEEELPGWMKKKLLKKDPKSPTGTEKKEEVLQGPSTAPNSEDALAPTPPAAEASEDPAGAPEGDSPEPSSEVAPVIAEEGEKEDEVPASFHLGRLMSMRSVKPPSAEEMFIVGMVVRMAPVRAVIKSELEDLKKEYPELDEGMAVLQQVDIDELEAQLDALEGAAGQIPQEYLDATGLSKSQQDLLLDLNRDALRAVVEVAQDPEAATTFSMEPFLTLNFDLISVSIALPLAGFSHGGETSFDLGNVTADVRFGHYFGSAPTFALGYGVTINAPTGTERADALALTGVLKSPRFMHAYLGMQPYVLMGLDFRYVQLQLDVGVSDLIKVREDEGNDNILYLRYGVGLTVIPMDSMGLFGEVAGAVGFLNADAYNFHQLTTGLRFHLAGIELAAAVQLPLTVPGSEAYGNNSGLAFGSPADIIGLLELDVAF